MAAHDDSLYEVEDMLNQPGTYFNPQTEVVVIVDDSASPDQEVFNDLEGYEGAEWVRVSDEVPVDEEGRDRALESFSTRSQAAGLVATELEESEDDFEEDEEKPQGTTPVEEEE